MAISRIGGKALKSNLERDSNLTFNTNTLAIDYTNSRIGIGTTNPTVQLETTGDAIIGGNLQVLNSSITVDDLRFFNNNITTYETNANIVIDPNGTGRLEVRSGITLESGVFANKIGRASCRERV